MHIRIRRESKTLPITSLRYDPSPVVLSSAKALVPLVPFALLPSASANKAPSNPFKENLSSLPANVSLMYHALPVLAPSIELKAKVDMRVPLTAPSMIATFELDQSFTFQSSPPPCISIPTSPCRGNAGVPASYSCNSLMGTPSRTLPLLSVDPNDSFMIGSPLDFSTFDNVHYDYGSATPNRFNSMVGSTYGFSPSTFQQTAVDDTEQCRYSLFSSPCSASYLRGMSRNTVVDPAEHDTNTGSYCFGDSLLSTPLRQYHGGAGPSGHGTFTPSSLACFDEEDKDSRMIDEANEGFDSSFHDFIETLCPRSPLLEDETYPIVEVSVTTKRSSGRIPLASHPAFVADSMTTPRTKEERRLEAIRRYKEKKKTRKWGNKMSYVHRSDASKRRPRQGGKFTKRITPGSPLPPSNPLVCGSLPVIPPPLLFTPGRVTKRGQNEGECVV